MDRFEQFTGALDAPAAQAVVITKSDSVDLAEVTRAIYVGGAGDLSVVMVSGQVATFTALPAGFILPVRARRVNATGSTATSLVGLS
jgi:hypothetical protein